MPSSLNVRKVGALSLISGFALFAVLAMQNCGSNVSFSPSDLLKEKDTADSEIPEGKALVYGPDAADQALLANKIAGYTAPALNEVLNNWRRISGPTIYASVSDIDISKQTNSFCYSSLSPTTGEWAVTKDAGGAKLSPGSSDQCINLGWFAAVSWSYLPTGHLHNATNSGNFNGFISALKFDQFRHLATVTSPGVDDDEIAIIIASTIDQDGVVHTLSASRTQGGTSGAGVDNWFVIYRKGNTQIKLIGAQAFDVVNQNGNTKAGDQKGWNGRKALISVERDGDMISAKTSLWQTDDSKLAIDDASEIKVDLSDPKLGLDIFRGEQNYGYGILSQQSSEFYNINFAAVHDDRYVFDLATDRVFEQQANGSYALVSGASAFAMLHPPIRIGNVETQRKYRLYSDHTFNQIFD